MPSRRNLEKPKTPHQEANGAQRNSLRITKPAAGAREKRKLSVGDAGCWLWCGRHRRGAVEFEWEPMAWWSGLGAGRLQVHKGGYACPMRLSAGFYDAILQAVFGAFEPPCRCLH